MPPAFTQDEYTARVAALQQTLAARSVDACVVTSPESMCYLTGHATPGYYTFQALVVPQEGSPHLVMRESEATNAAETTYVTAVHGFEDNHDPIAMTAAAVTEAAGEVARVGLEGRSWFLTPDQHTALASQTAATEVVAIDDQVAELRLVKSPAEISYLRDAARITNEAMIAAVAATVAGASESEIAAVIFSTLIAQGSGRLGMEPFVASGPRSGLIHSSWGPRVVQDGEPVLLEFAASREHYHAALMHTVAVGSLPPDVQAIAETCERARAATVAAIRPGATGDDCHRACVAAIEADGLGDYYRKRSGYSIGLAFAPDWGEGGLLSLGYGEKRPLEPGMVVHAVPALRKTGTGGFGLSSTVLVTEDGCEILTGSDSYES